jgi:histidinol-phosphate/aromatic aminotransferase/cobyric acid decarboxylase-like protein/CTP:phosphocholine cytidylyltransferase-like protein
MNALILAAGKGSRLDHLTKELPKTLLKINNETLLSRLCNQLHSIGIVNITVVIGFEQSKIIEEIHYIQQVTNQNFTFIMNDDLDKNNSYSFYLAKSFLMKDDYLVLESDLILENVFFKRISKFIKKNRKKPIAAGSSFETFHKGSFIKNKKIKSMDNFKFSYLGKVLKTINIYYLPKKISKDIFKKYTINGGYYEQEFKDIKFKSFLYNDNWFEIDTPQDFSHAKILFGSPSEKYKELSSKFGGFWRYPRIDNFILPTNDFLPKKALKYITEETSVIDYPSTQDYIRALAAKQTSIDFKNILVGNGSSEFIKILSQQSGEYNYHLPIFGEYKLFSRNQNSNDRIIVNPNNPDGKIVSKNEIIDMLDKGYKIILDESFTDFGYETMLDNTLLNKYPNLIIIKSYSKHLGIPGLRLGLLFTSNQEVIKDINKKLPIWNINSAAEKFLEILPLLDKELKKNLKKIEKEKRYLEKALSKFGKVTSVGNFIMLELTIDSERLCETLLNEYNILVKNLSENNLNAIRINIKDRQKNRKLINAIGKIHEYLENDLEQ